jgi:hypothetical protein
MRPFAVFACLLLLLSCASAYTIKSSREQMLAKYYENYDKIPKSARLLVGDESVNAYIGQSVIGIKIDNGELTYFEFSPVKNPGIVIVVSDSAAERIERGQMGILQAIDNGGIKITAKSFMSALKVEALKKIYAMSGADRELVKGQTGSPPLSNSIAILRARIVN